MISKSDLLALIESHALTAGVIGLGYVGLPLAVDMAKAGFKTIGFDVDGSKVESVNAGANYIADVDGEDLKSLVGSGTLRATTDFSDIAGVDFIAICVPTPLDSHQQPETTYISQACVEIASHLRRGAIVVLESTTYPGTTEELVKPILENGSGLSSGDDFYLGFSPERVDPGNDIYKTNNTPKVIGATTSDGATVISAFYSAILSSDVFTVSSPAVAEMEKILENTYRNVNIGLVNELAKLCHRMGIDIWEVIEAAKTKPYGFQAFYPGPGLGGHCIPLDPYYLSWKAREFGFHTSMIESSMMVNDAMPQYCVERAAEVLNQQGVALSSSRILVLGVSYKKDISDYRESPALRVIQLLENAQADVDYFDPYVNSYTYRGIAHQSLAGISPEVLQQYSLVLIATGHTDIDYSMVQDSSVAIFDTRNAMKDIAKRDNIVTL